jgi:hypothetical protein
MIIKTSSTQYSDTEGARSSMKSYRELLEIDTYYDRLQYLRLRGKPGVDNVDVDRFFAESFYRSAQWKKIRRDILLRDKFGDLGIAELNIPIGAIVHHINTITMDDIINANHAKLFDYDNLITASLITHNQIHYGGETVLPTERYRNDTIPWKKGEK